MQTVTLKAFVHRKQECVGIYFTNKAVLSLAIKKLLGYNDLKTTLRYLHTSKKDLLKIISPLDDLKLS